MYQREEKARLRRQRTQEAIALAMQSRWEEAIAANKGLLELFPTDADACNRLGRALMELGQYDQARQAYSQALALDPNNAIAKKNLSRLRLLGEGRLRRGDYQRVEPDTFIKETGKAGVVSLHYLSPKEVFAKMAAGDQVRLKAQGRALVVENQLGEYLGQVEPKTGARLLKLMEGGNHYSAAITSLNEDGVQVIIREVYQHPSQAGRLSFRVAGAEGFRPYVKESLLKHEYEPEAEEAEEAEYSPEGEGELESMHEEVPPYVELADEEEETLEEQ